ncbi:MAG: ATP-binding protein [Paracoccus sp. (in: a-proteobacteria)]|uniref:sensor histidine kinase n=1 Tax=Paracoccus sp. TaxID=267 RepID=UPI0026E0F662|nr:ATP-binding protein [Paracoccus sp. (in: a-proteobacteria)]MDO5622704.1 ATP-binding protein [Paracoccus sp. (in: a-proteobacteria)]
MSRWRETLRTTPMRLTLRLVALFLAISLTAFAATWWLTNKALLDATETALEQQIRDLTASDRAADIGAAVRAAAARADGEHLVIRYDGPQGVVGNYPGAVPDAKLAEARLNDDRHDVEGRYILLSKKVAGGRLTVGQDAEAFDELREIFLRVLMFTLLPTLVLALGGGVVMALRSARRLRAIEGVLSRLTAGDLTARLPALPGAADDLSRVGAGIDRLAAAQEASVSALRQVSADIAHDLKTPIQRLAVLLDQAREQAPDLDILDRATTEVNGIVETFHALLRIAQIEVGSPRARFAPVDLGALAETMAELYEPAAEETGHRLALRLHAPTTISGDRTLLGQVIANLIENALRHSPPGPVTLDVAGPVLSVADHGPGIPEAEREAVLRRLYRLDRARSTPGNGLGLALVDAIVKLHGGRLELRDNAPGLRVVAEFPQASGELSSRTTS